VRADGAGEECRRLHSIDMPAGETEKSWPLGTQAAPVCEVGVFPLTRRSKSYLAVAISF